MRKSEIKSINYKKCSTVGRSGEATNEHDYQITENEENGTNKEA